MDENREIKALPDFPDGIKKAIDSGNLVIFMGAGVSIFAGCDSWENFAKRLVEKSFELGKINSITKNSLLSQNDKIKTISICKNALGWRDFTKEMKKSLKDRSRKKVLSDKGKYQIYHDLRDLGDIFVTTNADRLFDSLIEDGNIVRNRRTFHRSDIHKYFLYKIHGCVSSQKSLVFTKENYSAVYGKGELDEFLEEIFGGKYTVLFVGYGLSEFQLLDRIYSATSPEEGSKRHYYLKEYFNHEEQLFDFEHSYFSDLGIELIPYSRNKKDYKQLIDVIHYWKEKSEEITHKMSISFKEIDEALENPTI